MAANNWTPTKPLPPTPRPPSTAAEAVQAKKNNAMFRVRKSRLGNKCVLQVFKGDIVKGPPPGFYDVTWPTDFAGFNIVPREDWDLIQKRFQLAEKRAAQQRTARKKKKDFEASQLAEDTRLPTAPSPNDRTPRTDARSPSRPLPPIDRPS